MDMLYSNPVLASAIVVAVLLPLLAVFRGRRRSISKEGFSLPPGPPAPWFRGNILPMVNISSTFVDWAHEYGSAFTVRQYGEISIVIARVDAAAEIMEKQGSALVDRPPMVAANELLSGGKRMTLVGSGERFRRFRKAIQINFQANALEKYKDIQPELARSFILDILDNPNNHQKHTHKYSASIILRITYGRSGTTSPDDPAFVGVKQVIAHFIEGMRPGAYLVDRFHWLKYIPGYGRRLREYHEFDLEFYRGHFSRVQHALSSSDDGRPSFSRTLLENTQDHQLSFDEMSFLAGTTFEAGSETTANAIIVMIMAAACFPDAQARVQEELDMVIGTDRLPDWNDWSDLPQLHAFISEAFRWRPVTPLGFSHRSTRDILWRGYYIPAGTTVMGNQWAISRDPVVFPDPEKFDPQRWLDQNGQLRIDIDCYAFGFGRRVCPGMYFANRSIFIALAHLLWSFRVAERPDTPIDTTPDMDNVVAIIAPFEVDFVPRIEKARLREAMVM